MNKLKKKTHIRKAFKKGFAPDLGLINPDKKNNMDPTNKRI